MRFLSYITLLTLFLFSCAIKKHADTTQDAGDEVDQHQTVKPQRPYQTKARIGKFPASDSIQIHSAIITGDLLLLEVSYSGGCGMHDFEFIGSEYILKSNPPKRPVQLIHYNRGDQCEALVKQQIEVDITDLSTSGVEIHLLLQGWKDPLIYKPE